MKEVTKKIEEGNSDVLRTLARAVHAIHGRRDPDLEQEAFIRTLEAFRKKEHVTHPEALMWKVVRDTVADHWRTRHRNRLEEMTGVPDDLAADRPAVEDAIDLRQRIDDLHAAISRLGCDVRGPVYLHYVEGYPVATIARLYGKSGSAVKMALHRGRRRLERMCEKRRPTVAR